MLKAVVTEEEFSNFADEIQAHYTKSKDGYTLSVESVNGIALENVTGLKSSLQAARKDVDTFKSKASKLEEQFKDIDATAARDALSKVAEMDNWDPEKKLEEGKKKLEQKLKLEADQRIEQATKKHTEALTAKDNELNTAVSQLQQIMIRSAAISALAEAEGNVDLLLPHVEAFAKTKQLEDGKYAVRILDGNGAERISPQGGSTDNMTIAELVDEMKNSDKFATAFKGSESTGSGADGGGRPKTGGTGIKVTDRTFQDFDEYKRTRALAEKEGKTVLDLAGG